MSDRIIPKRAGWWMATWKQGKPKPWTVRADAATGELEGHMSIDVDYCCTRVSDPRWRWKYEIPTPEQWEAAAKVIAAATDIDAIGDQDNALGDQDQRQKAFRKLHESLWDLAKLQGGSDE